jgi:hypothetical protein
VDSLSVGASLWGKPGVLFDKMHLAHVLNVVQHAIAVRCTYTQTAALLLQVLVYTGIFYCIAYYMLGNSSNAV